MSDIQPKNTTGIHVDTIDEKTASAGITLKKTLKVDTISQGLAGTGVAIIGGKADTIVENTGGVGVLVNSILKFITGATHQLIAQFADVDLGTIGTPFANLFCKTVKAAVDMSLGTTTPNTIFFQTNSVNRLTLQGAANEFSVAGGLKRRLGHANYTSGGEIQEITAAVDSVSTTGVVLCIYSIPNGNTQVALRVDILSRDNATGAQCYMEALVTGFRAGAGAIAGAVTVLHTVGSALHTLSVGAGANFIDVGVQNVSGTNTTSCIACIREMGVSTAT